MKNTADAPDWLSGHAALHTVLHNVTLTTVSIGRNDPCPCGSGKKYKRCWGAADAGGPKLAVMADDHAGGAIRDRRWLLWREEAVTSGVTEPADVRAALVRRQRKWETTPHSAHRGATPVEAIIRERDLHLAPS